jgi:hypothetical protein
MLAPVLHLPRVFVFDYFCIFCALPLMIMIQLQPSPSVPFVCLCFSLLVASAFGCGHQSWVGLRVCLCAVVPVRVTRLFAGKGKALSVTQPGL